VAVKVRYADYQLTTRQRTFPRPVQDAEEIAGVVHLLLQMTEGGRRPVRLVGVSVSGFVPQKPQGELPLFEGEKTP
jgi:DNA polymerase-4